MSNHLFKVDEVRNYLECVFCGFKSITSDAGTLGALAACDNPDEHPIEYRTLEDLQKGSYTFTVSYCNGPKDPHDMCGVHNPLPGETSG